MTIELKFYADNSDLLMGEFRSFCRALGFDTAAPSEGVRGSTAEVAKERVKPGKKNVNGPAEPVAEQQPQMFPEVKTVEELKAEEKPAEEAKAADKSAEVIDEAACRAALQFLHSCHSQKKDSPGGVRAARTICEQFGVKKVSDLKPEQYQPFHAATHAAALEVQKS